LVRCLAYDDDDDVRSISKCRRSIWADPAYTFPTDNRTRSEVSSILGTFPNRSGNDELRNRKLDRNCDGDVYEAL